MGNCLSPFLVVFKIFLHVHFKSSVGTNPANQFDSGHCNISSSVLQQSFPQGMLGLLTEVMTSDNPYTRHTFHDASVAVTEKCLSYMLLISTRNKYHLCRSNLSFSFLENPYIEPCHGLS